MKKINLLLIVLLTTSLFAQKELTAKEIFEKSIESTRLTGSEGISIMKIFDERGRKRVRRLYQITKLTDNGNTEKKLIRFLAPADVKGTGFLTYDYRVEDDDKWLYMPALRKTRRIISSENAKSFMGSEFSYADMTPPAVDEFSFKILSEEKIENIICYKIEMIPNDDEIADENGFSKKITFIGKDDYVPRKSVYYDLDGEIEKEFLVKDLVELDKENKKFRLTHIEMHNLQNKRKSILTVDKLKLLKNVKDFHFTTRNLEK